MPFETLETRWFFSGALDPRGPEVQAFRALEVAPREDEVTPPDWPDGWREDTYLVIGGADDVGMKWRGEGPEARFEIKCRLGPVPWAEELESPAVYTVERWVKWSYAGGQVPEALARVRGHRPEARQVVVRKKRLIRRFRLDAGGGIREVGLQVFPDRQAEAELTRLEVGGRAFWTLGLEASPGDVGVASEFAPLVRAFRDVVRGPPDGADPSSSWTGGYPGWLRSLVESGSELA